MGNIDINSIRKKGFKEGTNEAIVEEYCRRQASEHTDGILELYYKKEGSYDGRYINSDLMKMVFPFYANSYENRQKYNLSITNSAAVLTNEAYRRAVLDEGIKRCIYIVGPYGAGKSYFCQSLFESGTDLLDKSIVYEGSITPPAFGEKVQYAMDNGVTPYIIALNPTLELSLRNIKERAKRTGRDVIKEEVIDKYSHIYEYLKALIDQFPEIPYVIYNKESNVTIDLNGGSQNLEDIFHGSIDEIDREYDRLVKIIAFEDAR